MRWNDDWWAETTLLYAATSNADSIVKACLAANTGPALALAFDCTDQDSDIEPELRERINELVTSASRPDADQDHRRLFAGILLARHVRQRERTSGGVQISVRPVPAAIYRLFMADMPTLGGPDTLPVANSQMAVGMRSRFADGFVRWANGLSGEQRSYRLPLAAEITELAAQQRIPVLQGGHPPYTWVQTVSASTGTRVGLWRPAGTSEPYETDNTALIDAVKNDVAQSALMLSVLQLLRSRIMTRRLAFGPEPVIDPSLDRDLMLARDLALNLATGLPLALARALPLALARELDFVRNPAAVDLPHLDGLDLNLAGDIEIALGLTDPHLAPAPARVLAGVLDLARVLDLACVLDGDLGLDSDLALALMIRIDVVVDRYLRSNPDTSAFQAKLDEGCRLVLGRAFSEAFMATLQTSSHSNGWTARFTEAFIDVVGVGLEGHLTADPESLEATLRETLEKLADTLRGKAGARLSYFSWPFTMAERLTCNARPIFSRAELPSPEKATAIRMAALCLAAEADGLERKDIGDGLRQAGGRDYPP